MSPDVHELFWHYTEHVLIKCNDTFGSMCSVCVLVWKICSVLGFAFIQCVLSWVLHSFSDGSCYEHHSFHLTNWGLCPHCHEAQPYLQPVTE